MSLRSAAWPFDLVGSVSSGYQVPNGRVLTEPCMQGSILLTRVSSESHCVLLCTNSSAEVLYGPTMATE